MVAVLLMQKIAQLFLIMFLGYVVVKAGALKADDSVILSKLAIYLLMPCVVIHAFQVDFTEEIRSGFIFGTIMAVVILVVMVFIGKACRKLFHMDEIEMASVVYSNSVNLIIPIVTYVLGPEWIIYTSSFFSVQLIFMWSHGVSLFSDKGKMNLKKIILNPNMLSVFAGGIMLVTGIRFPSLVNDTLSSMTDMLGPVSMLIVGMVIAKTDMRAMIKRKRIYLVMLFRMLFCPLVTLVLLKLSRGEMLVPNGEKILLITFLAAISPSASIVTQFSQLYGKDEEYAGAINIMTTLSCIVTMPMFVFLYELL